MRDTLRKIASLGQELPSRHFLTLLWAKMLQKNHLLPPAEGDPGLESVLGHFSMLLKSLPGPGRGKSWAFFGESALSGTDLNSARVFWQGLQKADFNPVWQSADTIGWIYQFFLEPHLAIFRSPRSPKITPSRLAIRTQQFTPKWIAEFLVANTLGRYWQQMHPDSELARSLIYLVHESPGLSPVPAKPAREMKILDPACGTMHLGLPAIELLKTIYREELSNAGRPGWPAEPSVKTESEIPDSILRNNLYGIDIDPLAIELAALTLFLGTGGTMACSPNLFCADTLKKNLHSRLRHSGFPAAFDVVLLNPPYLDKRDYHAKLKTFMTRHYSKSSRNLYTAFLERSLDLLTPGGRLGAVTPQTFMFIRSFEALRKMLLERTAIETLVHTGLNTFDDAVVDCAFYILRREPDSDVRTANTGRFFQLTASNNPTEKHGRLVHSLAGLGQTSKETLTHSFPYRQADFSALPESPWVYWITPRIRRLFSELPPLGQIAELRQGLATTHNERFLRYGWEIPRDEVAWDCRTLDEAQTTGKKWFPYMKGGGYSKWFGMREFLVNWQDDGKEIKAEIARRYPYLKGNWQWVAKNTHFYFREGITYSYLTSGMFGARYSPAGSIFDVAGSSIFCNDLHLVLAILNSRFCRFALGLINPTVNFQVGDLQRLPIPDKPSPPHLRHLVDEAISLARGLETYEETSPDFVTPLPWPDGLKMIEKKHRRLMQIQRQIDRDIYLLYGLDKTDQKLIEEQTQPDQAMPTLTRSQLAFRWISYAVGRSLGRFDSKSPDLLCPVVDWEREGLAGKVSEQLNALLGPVRAHKVIDQVCRSQPLSAYLAREFFEQHYQQYRQRPVYWLLKFKTGFFAMYYQRLTADRIKELLPKNARDFPFHLDNGILANMRPFRRNFPIPAWKKI